MWQRAFVLKDLAKVAAIDPSTACRAADEVLGLAGRWIAETPSNVFAAGNVGHLVAVQTGGPAWSGPY
jgi:hypothetical protein